MRISDWSSDVCSSDLLESARGGAEQLVQHQLPCVPVEPAQPVGHDVRRQDANAELVARAQPLRNRAVQVAAREPQLVGKFLGAPIQNGEMVAPLHDRAADRGGLRRIAPRFRTALRRPIEQRTKGSELPTTAWRERGVAYGE